MTPIATMS